MRLYNKIFGKKPSLSIDEMEDYISENLSEKERYEIELKAQSSDLDFDAMDAFEKNPEKLNDFNDIKSQISADIFRSTSYLKYFIITGIAATITIFFVFYANIFNKENNNFIAGNLAISETSQEEKEQKVTTKTKELFIDEVQDNLINDKSAIAEEEISVEISKNEDNTIIKSAEQKEKIEIVNIEPKKLETISSTNEIKNKTKLAFAYNSPIKHLAHYKVIDYSYYKRTNNSEKKNDLGTDAKYANETDKTKKQSLNDEELNLSYFSFLEKALYKYDKQKYTETILMLNTILEQYPDDLNATFYKGMSYYQLKKYEKSISYFDTAINSELNIFNQEAEYYKALALLHTNKSEGIQLLQKITNDALFYSQKAMIKLNEINE